MLDNHAFNEDNKSYVEIFKEWLETNSHTSTLETINWESSRNKIKISFYDRDLFEGFEDLYESDINPWYP